MSARAKLLRKKLKEKKEQSQEAEKKKLAESVGKEGGSDNNISPDINAQGPGTINIKVVNTSVSPSKKKDPTKIDDIDPLKFFEMKQEEKIIPAQPKEENKPITINALLGIVEKPKEEEKKEEKEEEKEESSDDDEEEKKEQQRLQNKILAQQKLFSNSNNRVSPNPNLFKPKKSKVSEELTKEIIMEKFGDDFDGAVELPELNEQKKQIMLKKMRKTINKMSSLRIQKHMDSELRHMIEEKIEELKKIKGVNYCKIASTVEELILSLKQPDYYFGDDEDVHQISDVQEPYNIEPRKDIDFAFLMKQTGTNPN